VRTLPPRNFAMWCGSPFPVTRNAGF